MAAGHLLSVVVSGWGCRLSLRLVYAVPCRAVKVTLNCDGALTPKTSATVPSPTRKPQTHADLQAKAHGYVANTLRILGSFQDAEAEIARADRRLLRGVGSGREEARILSFAATLRADQHRHRDALALLDQVEALSLVRRSPHQRARSSMRRARVLHAAGRLSEAADAYTRAALDLNPSEEPRLVGLIQQNAVHYLARAGETRRARDFFETLPPTDDRMILIRRKWVEAHLLRAERRPREARECFDATRGAFLAAGLRYDAELVEQDRVQADS